MKDWAFEAREHLRALSVGKEVTFTSTYSVPPTDGTTRDFGHASINGIDLATELLKSGWAKPKDIKREPTEEDLQRRALESEAKAAGLGLWNPDGPPVSLRYP